LRPQSGLKEEGKKRGRAEGPPVMGDPGV